MVSLPAFTLLRFLFLPVLVKLAQKNQPLKRGLNYWYVAPPLLKGTAAFLKINYSNYHWHVLNHKWPSLWRFHVVHHSDPDLDGPYNCPSVSFWRAYRLSFLPETICFLVRSNTLKRAVA